MLKWKGLSLPRPVRPSNAPWLVGCVLAVAAGITGCSLGDFDALGAGLDAGSGGTGGSDGTSGSSGNGGDGGTSGSGGTDDGGSGGTSGSGGSAGAGGTGGTDQLPPQEGNLFLNADFDDPSQPSRFTPLGGCISTLSDMNPRSGDFCLLTTNRAEAWQGPAHPVTSIVRPGNRYTVTAWVRLESTPDAGAPASSTLQLTLKTLCENSPENGTFTTVAGSTTSVGGEWTELTGTVLVPDCVSTDSALYVENPNGALEPYPNFYIDDTSLFAVEE